jgi:hypothetical protein
MQFLDGFCLRAVASVIVMMQLDFALHTTVLALGPMATTKFIHAIFSAIFPPVFSSVSMMAD